ncbi:thermonuclease family protein [Candidatus Poribacteria bacterium]
MRSAIFAGFLVVFLLITGCGEDKNTKSQTEFTVERIIDGDTVVLTDGRIVRYIGINTPELNEPYYEEAKEANRLLVEGKKVRLELDEQEKDRYGRTLAYIYVSDVSVNVELVRDGYARAYPYPPNTKYESAFANAEEEARQKSVGIWSSRPQERKVEIAKINYDAQGNDRENLNDEWVIVANNTDASVNMAGFTLSDSSDHVFTFGNLILSAGRSITVFSGRGMDGPISLYWNSSVPVWNNDEDTAYLKDADGTLIDEYSY